MFQMIEILGYKAPFTPAQAAARKYPLQFLCNFAYAIFDKDTGNLLEYRHLIKHPKYRTTWSQSFGKEIGQLATTTETIVFINKHQIPKDHQGDVTYSRIVCDVRKGKKGQALHKTHNGGQPTQLPRWLRNSNSQSSNSQNSTKQHHFDAKRKIHDHQYQGFLLEYTHGTIQIFQHEAWPIPRRCHSWIQPSQQSGYKWKCPLQSMTRNVQTTTGRHHCTRAPRDTPPQSRIHTIKTHARILETHMEPKGTLPNWRRLGRDTIHRTHCRLGLQEAWSAYLRARLCWESTNMFLVTKSPNIHNTNRTNTQYQPMEPPSSMPKWRKSQDPWPKMRKNTSNRWLAHFCTTSKQWTQQCSQVSAP